MKTIFAKIFIGYAALIVVVSGAFLYFSIDSIRTEHINTLREGLKNLAVSVNETATNSESLDAIAASSERRITVVDTAGTVAYDSESDPLSMENHKDRPEITAALSGGIGSSIRLSHTLNEDLLYVAIPMKRDGKIAGAIRVSMSLAVIDRQIRDFSRSVVIVAVVILIVSLGIAYLLSRFFSRPIKELAAASREIARGNFAARIHAERTDEIGDLARNFNHMAAEISFLFSEISRQKEQLSGIVNSMQESLAVIDGTGRVIFGNDRFCALFPNLSTGKFYWEDHEAAKLGVLFNSCRKDRKALLETFESGSKEFLCSVSASREHEDVVVILHELSELQHLERVKKDLVASVSHELRTPLTAIKGYVETLQEDECDEERRRYFDIIQRHTERLMNIVQDLLTLSRLEERGEKLEIEKVNIRALVDAIAKIMREKAAEKGLVLSLNVSENVPQIDGDSFKLEQMLVNLVDNAIKYTEKGGVTISAQNAGNGIRIAVSDTGIGIEKEHLGRIFERFYVVDKSRSRRLGGTGLGLSIVKHIVLLHRGTIEVESVPGNGTTFFIFLPR